MNDDFLTRGRTFVTLRISENHFLCGRKREPQLITGHAMVMDKLDWLVLKTDTLLSQKMVWSGAHEHHRTINLPIRASILHGFTHS